MALSDFRRRWRKRFYAGGGVLLALLCLYLARNLLFQLAGDVLVRSDDLTGNDGSGTYAILLMGDGSTSRADKAVELYRAKKVGRIIVAQERPSAFIKIGIAPSGMDIHALYLKREGVPTSDIVMLKTCDNVSTYDEALCVLAYLKQQPAVDHVVLVTSWYHTSRAGWLFDRLYDPIKVLVVPAANDDSRPERWWRSRDSSIMVLSEYIKWGYWRFRYANWES